MRKIAVANWKMNPASEAEAVALSRASDVSSAVICPPFVFLDAVRRVVQKAALGVQDVFWETRGAYTGEISPLHAKAFGAAYAIIGHSERRRNLGETDGMVGKKAKAALSSGLTPIVCVGETQEERGRRETAAVLRRQLSVVAEMADSCIITYEPVWAISTNQGAAADTPEDAREAVEVIRAFLSSRSVRILYGGSVNASNAEDFLRRAWIQGVLVGGASLRGEEFQEIARAAERNSSTG